MLQKDFGGGQPSRLPPPHLISKWCYRSVFRINPGNDRSISYRLGSERDDHRPGLDVRSNHPCSSSFRSRKPHRCSSHNRAHSTGSTRPAWHRSSRPRQPNRCSTPSGRSHIDRHHSSRNPARSMDNTTHWPSSAPSPGRPPRRSTGSLPPPQSSSTSTWSLSPHRTQRKAAMIANLGTESSAAGTDSSPKGLA